jgi:hypothetical protein
MGITPLAKIPSTNEIVERNGTLAPVVLDLGKTKKKLIKALKHGEGPLMEDVAHAVEAVRSNLASEMDGKAIIPVVIVYEKKVSRKGLLPLLMS